MAAKLSDVQSLLGCSVLKVLDHLPNFISDVHILPANLKDKLLYLMCKRGLVTDANVMQLLHEKVAVLDLSEGEVSDAALHQVAALCPRLRKIDLNSSCRSNRTAITDVGISEVAQRCHFLQVVYLRRCCSLTDESVISLSTNCRGLRELNVGGCNLLTDRSLEALGQHCAQLQCVNFARAKVTDEGIFSLVNGACANSLQEVHMDGCVALTDEAVEAVVQFCPRISILLFHSCPNLTDRSRQALEATQAGNHSKMKQVTWTIY